ncbi:Acetylornithine deacetylase/Succinyl-diaminopimelate desuccinylase [Methylacidimicrobium sp. AP8]|uniref:M20 family metallopeptidase n=1 Tax=Methylacidimicrobium sp. AP8 TaxID=2730359 RepID=UPI0018C18B07|nr:ArgE/DapE family deacylase [Methylacidimicrobium sp. AP8]CAB4242675.1 Acetylornithine deacetylase/Succinyl-diaminopimelate desuccinylase [Methylacidimicrobium sp. AP8]
MKTGAEAWLVEHEGELCSFLGEIVRIPTVNPPGDHYTALVERLEAKLRKIGLSTEIFTVPPEVAAKVLPPQQAGLPRHNLVGRWEVGAERTVQFNAHYDVVPAAGRWRHAPFAGERDGDWIFGRGTADMKGALAAAIFAVEALLKTGSVPRVNVELAFVADEEIGGELGTGYLVTRRRRGPDFAVVCEGGAGGKIGIGHNGLVQLEVTVLGKGGHSAYPDGTVNAFERMVALVSRLEPVLKQSLAEPQRRFATPSGEVLEPVVNLGGVFGPGDAAKVNIIPGEASFTIDRRLTPAEQVPAVERELREWIRSAAAKSGVRTRIRTIHATAPCSLSPGAPLPRAFRKAVEGVRGGRARFTVNRGATDMHYYVRKRRIDAVGYGVDGKNIHAVEERIPVKDLVTTARVYARFLYDFAPESGKR